MISFIFALSFFGHAEDVESMIKKTEQLYRAQSSLAEMTMTIVNPNWKRQLRMQVWSETEKKTLIRIKSPRKEKGVSTLRIDNEMWNYFPKINKVIKVPPSMMMGSWMGSDFNNDDLVKQTSLTDEYAISLVKAPKKWTFTLVPKENTTTVWGKLEIITEPETLIPLKYLYYNERGKNVRSMTFSDKKMLGGKMMPSKLEMINLAKDGQKTVVEYNSLKVDVKFKKNFFSLRSLKSKVQ